MASDVFRITEAAHLINVYVQLWSYLKSVWKDSIFPESKWILFSSHVVYGSLGSERERADENFIYILRLLCISSCGLKVEITKEKSYARFTYRRRCQVFCVRRDEN
jgi:hypothetical protein